MSQLVVTRDLALSVRVLDETYADVDQQAIRVVIATTLPWSCSAASPRSDARGDGDATDGA